MEHASSGGVKNVLQRTPKTSCVPVYVGHRLCLGSDIPTTQTLRSTSVWSPLKWHPTYSPMASATPPCPAATPPSLRHLTPADRSPVALGQPNDQPNDSPTSHPSVRSLMRSLMANSAKLQLVPTTRLGSIYMSSSR